MNEQENIRFRAETTHDLPVHKEFQQAAALANPVTVISSCLIILVMIFCGITFLISPYPTAYAESYIWIIVIYLLITFLPKLFNRKGDINFKRMVQANQGTPVHSIYEFCDSHIRILNVDFDNTGSVRYEQIVKIIETKNLYVLMMKYQQGFSILRKSLSCQDADFTQFLTQKCAKLKRKKVYTVKFGRIIGYVKTAVIAIALLLAVWNLPFIQKLIIPEGQLSNYSSSHQIAAELEKLGISGIDEATLDEFEEFYGNYEEYYTFHNEKIIDLLCWMGYGEYDPESWDWTPATSGVFWMEFESYEVDKIYSNFLKGVQALDPSLQWSDIQEDLSNVDLENNRGVQAGTFTWNGRSCRIEGEIDYDWFDVDAADQLNEIIKENHTGKQLYFAYDNGAGCLIFYRDAQWAKNFMDTTGILLYSNAREMYYGVS